VKRVGPVRRDLVHLVPILLAFAGDLLVVGREVLFAVLRTAHGFTPLAARNPFAPLPVSASWHITWSLGPGREAKESNDVLRDGHWERFGLPIPVKLEPARFR
jgi:hypothetical protein